MDQVGIAGHSSGARTVQAMAGQVFGRAGKLFHEERIKTALALSPSGPRFASAENAFGQISLPMMLMTGTRDGSPIGGTTPEQRLEVFPALPEGDKYELVLKDAEHHAFSDVRRGEKSQGKTRNPNHHRVIQALGTAFFEAYLMDRKDAKTWLNSEAVGKILEEGDRWQRK